MGAMRPVTEEMIARIEKADLSRQLSYFEKKAAEVRSQLGYVQRETMETVTQAEAIKRDNVVRMRTDQLSKLCQQDKLSGGEQEAAYKFRRIFEAMSRGLYPGAADRLVGTQSRSTYRHPLERMTEEEFFVWFYEYRPWAAASGAKTAINKDNFKLSYLKICYAVIIDNYGPAQLERMWPVSRGNGVVMALFKKALRSWKHRQYCTDAQLEGIRRQMIDEAKGKIQKLERDVNIHRQK